MLLLKKYIIILNVILMFHPIVYCNESKEKSFATSVADMEQLIFTEQILIETIEKFTDELQEKVNTLKNLISHLKYENQKAISNPEKYLYNPLNGFSLIRRMHYDWTHIELFLQKPVGESYFKILQKYRPELPTSQDVYEASEAISRLQKTYDLKAADMGEGILNGKQYNVTLTSIDRFSMGSHLFGKKDYYHAAYWLYSTIGSYEASDYNRIMDFKPETVWSLYAENLLKQNRPADALKSIKTASNFKPDDAFLMKRRNEIEYLAKVNNEPEMKYHLSPPTSYQMGCRGVFSNTPSRFHCIYNFTTIPFLRLAPLKMEILELEPYMVMYHDVISDEEIKYLQELAKPNLKRATVFSRDAEKSQVVETRTSKFSWFLDDTSPYTLRISQRIRDMTGFDLKGSEMLQVMNYGMGGHYDTHYDFFNVSDSSNVVRQEGDRISTVLFYLSDVEQGGATVFPNIQQTVFPRKGSAVVWYNLNNRLEGDSRTLHAACPVIVGSKWVCNKWIRSKAQMFRRPCYR